MAKDPAFLFYYQDFLVGTEFMSDEDIGKYIRILCHLADKGELTEKQVLSICKASAIPEEIQNKLNKNGNGTYYNEKLRDVVNKRRKFTESRRKNAASAKHMLSTSKASVKHVENENENENKDKNKRENLEKRMIKFRDHLKDFEKDYDKDMLQAFYDYWSEPNKSKTKMKCELQVTWDTSRRLKTWERNNNKFGDNGKKEFDPFRDEDEIPRRRYG